MSTDETSQESAGGLGLRDAEGNVTPLPATGRLLVGSDRARVQLVVRDAGVDPVHCAVCKEESGGWSVQDLGSRGGTEVNDAPVERVRLWTGDTISIGATRLTVVDPEQTPRARRRKGGAPAAAAPARGHTKSAPEVPGYELQRLLGKGGMGEVWLARQINLDRPVALKLLAPALGTDEGFVARFQAEARAAAALSHPNVVVVYDVGQHEGQHYLAMEFMEGGSLEDQVAKRGPLSWREAATALRDCASGLVYAEQRGIVHRDVKPDNLMRGTGGTVKLADLGLAASTQRGGDDGRILGTPHFLAPEQAQGASPDPRSDLYSLGATAFRLLTARTPFQGKTTRDILRAHRDQAPTAPGAFVGGVPEALDRLVLQLLEKRPEQRPAGAEAVVSELDRLLRGGSVEVVQEAPERRRNLALAGGAAVLAVAGFLLLRGGDEPDPSADPASQPTPSDSVSSPGPGPAAVGGAGATASGATDGASGGPSRADDGSEDGGSGDTGDFFDGPSLVPDAGEDVERALEQRELAAQVALSSVPLGLDDAQRLEAFRELAAQYEGTPTARSLTRRIADLERSLARASTEREGQDRARSLARAALVQAIDWPPAEGDATWPIGGTLRALFATASQRKEQQPADSPDNASPEGPEPSPDAEASRDPDQPQDPEQPQAAGAGPAIPAVTEDPALTAARAELVDEVVARALVELDGLPQRIDALLEGGEFEQAVTLADATVARLDLPPAPERVPSGWQTLVTRATELETRATGLRAEVRERLERQLAEERLGLAALLGPGGSLRGALEEGDLPGTLAGLDAYIATLRSDPVRERAGSIRGLLQGAQGARVLLRDSFRASEWRRTSLSLVEPAFGAGTVEGVDEAGLTVQVDGVSRRISWGVFEARPDQVDGLLRGRFARELSAEEARAVLALLRVSAARRAAALAVDVLDPAGGVFSTREGDELEQLLDDALDWIEDQDALSDDADLRARVQRERDAVGRLRRALVAFQEGHWSASAAGLERLLREDGEFLFVALLSDGTPP